MVPENTLEGALCEGRDLVCPVRAVIPGTQLTVWCTMDALPMTTEYLVSIPLAS